MYVCVCIYFLLGFCNVNLKDSRMTRKEKLIHFTGKREKIRKTTDRSADRFSRVVLKLTKCISRQRVFFLRGEDFCKNKENKGVLVFGS